MKNRCRLLILLIIAVLCTDMLPVSAAPLTSSEKEQMYSAAILDLETYLETYGKSGTSLWGIEQVFGQLGGYEQSRPLMYYTQVLSKIEKAEYTFDMDLLLDMLENNSVFNDYLHDTLKGSAIQSVKNLKAYATAREMEFNGRNNEAIEQYRQCLSFFDADSRYYELTVAANQDEYDNAMSMLQYGDYAGGYFALLRISNYGDSADRAKAIVNQLGYTPKDENDNPEDVRDVISNVGSTSIGLSWTKPKHATGYKISMRVKGEKDWHYFDWKNDSVYWNDLQPQTTYEFSIVTVVGKVELQYPPVITVTTLKPATPTPKPTKTPTPKPTKTPTPRKTKTPTPKPTKTPTPRRTKTPTPRPTKTPTPRTTKTPTPKPRTFKVNTPTISDGVTTIRWEDSANAGPYTVTVQHRYTSGGSTRLAAARTFVSGTSSKSASNGNVMVPGEPYTITVKDKNGKTATVNYQPAKRTYPDFKIGASLDLKTKTPNGTKNQSSLSAADIKKNISSYTYGGILRLTYSQIRYERTTNWTIAFLTPNGDALVDAFYEWHIPAGNTYSQWNHYPFNYLFDSMIYSYGSVPTGKYTWVLYFDGQQVSSTTFNVKN